MLVFRSGAMEFDRKLFYEITRIGWNRLANLYNMPNVVVQISMFIYDLINDDGDQNILHTNSRVS